MKKGFSRSGEAAEKCRAAPQRTEGLVAKDTEKTEVLGAGLALILAG